jgi:hypothetical protein
LRALSGAMMLERLAIAAITVQCPRHKRAIAITATALEFLCY